MRTTIPAHIELIDDEVERLKGYIFAAKDKLFTDKFQETFAHYSKGLWQNMYMLEILEGLRHLLLLPNNDAITQAMRIDLLLKSYREKLLTEKPYKESTNALENFTHNWKMEASQHLVKVLTGAYNTAKAIEHERTESIS